MRSRYKKVSDAETTQETIPETPQSKVKESKEKKSKGNIFIPPNIQEVRAYCLERNNNVDADKWHDFYSSKGWMVGKNKMKDWKAAIRTWEKGDNQSVNSTRKGVNNPEKHQGDSKPWENDPYLKQLGYKHGE
jgi:hypothetical protein